MKQNITTIAVPPFNSISNFKSNTPLFFLGGGQNSVLMEICFFSFLTPLSWGCWPHYFPHHFTWQDCFLTTRENKHHHMESTLTSWVTLASQHPYMHPPLGTSFREEVLNKVISLHLFLRCHLFLSPSLYPFIPLRTSPLFSNICGMWISLFKKDLQISRDDKLYYNLK